MTSGIQFAVLGYTDHTRVRIFYVRASSSLHSSTQLPYGGEHIRAGDQIRGFENQHFFSGGEYSLAFFIRSEGICGGRRYAVTPDAV